jgi:hypothetical protein
MTSTIYVRHRCDRCDHTLEVEHEKDAPGLPVGWQFAPVKQGEPVLLCAECAEALEEWLHAKPKVQH